MSSKQNTFNKRRTLYLLDNNFPNENRLCLKHFSCRRHFFAVYVLKLDCICDDRNRFNSTNVYIPLLLGYTSVV